MDPSPSGVRVTDIGAGTCTFKQEVLRGLASVPRSIPSKYFYDARGSQLFDRITELEVYYPTRTEREIMENHVEEMVDCLGPRCLLVELGSGSSQKTRILLDKLIDPTAYVPIDISRAHLTRSAHRLSSTYPHLEILPVVADYTETFDLPSPSRRFDRIAIYFPGSTIGNLSRRGARRFLARTATVSGSGGALLIGVDLQKERRLLEAAYNDGEGVTSAFNKNLLSRMNRELGSNFDLDTFEHQAVYNEQECRIEMYLVSLRDQRVRVDEQTFDFLRGERICTEWSHKYTRDSFDDLSRSAGWCVEHVWTDSEHLFSVQYLVST